MAAKLPINNSGHLRWLLCVLTCLEQERRATTYLVLETEGFQEAGHALAMRLSTGRSGGYFEEQRWLLNSHPGIVCQAGQREDGTQVLSNCIIVWSKVLTDHHIQNNI